jgi:hypothetical protein
MRRKFSLVFLLVAMSCSRFSEGGTSVERPIALGKPTGRMEVILKRVESIRELMDGRVWINGGNNFTEYVLFDFSTQSTSTPLRRGQGPGELGGQPYGIMAAGGDSSFIREVLQAQLFVIDGTRLVGTLTQENRALAGAGRDVAWADRSGNVYAVREPKIHVGDYDITKKDSVDVLRYYLRTGQEQLLTKIRLPEYHVTAIAAKDNPAFFSQTRFDYPGFAVGEVAAGSADGWVAVARLEPYRVDWLTPGGEWVKGKPIEQDERNVSDADKQAYMASIAKASGDTVLPSSWYKTWPLTIPPFISQWVQALVPTGDGKVLVRKAPTADHPEPRYDLVNRKGELEGQLSLGASETLIGAGSRTIYTLEIDEEGGQWLRRYAWPVQ